MNGIGSDVHEHCCLRFVASNTAVKLVKIGKEGVDSNQNWIYFIALEELFKQWGSAVNGVSYWFCDY